MNECLRAASGSLRRGPPRLLFQALQGSFLQFHQHARASSNTSKSIVQKAGLQRTDIVLEIGPETGNLTMKLLEVCQKVIAVELDPRTVLEVTRRVQGTPFASKLQVIQGDILKTELPYFDVCYEHPLSNFFAHHFQAALSLPMRRHNV